MRQKTRAIPIRCVDFSNSSQVVSAFTRDFGLVEGIAKGAHREKSPFQGPFDLGVLYEIVFLDRRAGGLAILTEGTVLDGFRGLRSSWSRHVAASHLLEMLRAVTTGEPEPELFDLASETLSELAQAKEVRAGTLLARFDVAALLLLGFLAPLDSCVECGRARPGGVKPACLSPQAHGILCRSCRELKPHLGGVLLPGASMEVLDTLTRGDVVALEPSVLDERWQSHGPPVARAIAQLRTNVLERELVLLKSSRSWI